MRSSALLVAAFCWLAAGAAFCRDTVKMLCDFEDEAEVGLWDFPAGRPRLVREGVTHGRHALEIQFDPAGPYHPAYMVSWRLPADWSAYDALVLDVTNPSGEPMPGYVLVGDRAWREKGATYWNRHNGTTVLPPGRSEWVIPVHGLYRGEAGSRNRDIQRNIDPDSIVRVDFGFGAKGARGKVIVDALRLVKAGRPAGVWAFDFGPPGQSVMLGWTAVSNETAYAPERGYGWWPPQHRPWDGAARDTTFGPMLTRDFCEAGGYTFRVDVPAGLYRVMVIYENCGYWGGEQAQHSERRILCQGRVLWSETRPDGPAHALWRFEDVEPVGVDLWETYMAAEITRPVWFEVEAQDGWLEFSFEADRPWGSKVSALALCRAGDAEGLRWLEGQVEALARAFRRAAVCLDGPPAPFEPPAGARLVAWPVRIEDEVTPNSVPPGGRAPGQFTMERLAVRGEYEPFCVAVRPAVHLGECCVRVEPFVGPGRLEPDVRAVSYNTSRGFNTIAYRIRPHTLRPVDRLDFPAELTRELVVTAHVPEDAQPGLYEGRLVLENAASGAVELSVPLRLRVSPVVLDRRTDFLMGFFGLMPPGLLPQGQRRPVLEQTLRMLREHGMNAVSGGPNWTLKGWQDGRPVVDFGQMDDFFDLLRGHGFTGPLNGYGGARFVGLHERWAYYGGDVAKKVEAESGLPYSEALMRAWQAVHEHARAHRWPTILYAMCDETRVRETAERELEFMKLMARVSAAFPETVRTSGSYSVTFSRRPADPDDMLYWHQRFFEVLDISSLNNHDQTVLAEARRLGKQVHIYNQGRTRFSFGLYQWCEYRRGVKARWQWHLNILHGYQFFDLDGREPDTAMICYGRSGIYPTIHFERCREGAEDFYLYNTLARAVEQAGSDAPADALAAARALLKALDEAVPLNHRTPPEGYDADALKARVVAALEALKQAR